MDFGSMPLAERIRRSIRGFDHERKMQRDAAQQEFGQRRNLSGMEAVVRNLAPAFFAAASFPSTPSGSGTVSTCAAAARVRTDAGSDLDNGNVPHAIQPLTA